MRPPPPGLYEKHPRAIRWFHWINFPLLFFMIWSGLMIYWANPVFRVGLGRYTVFHFFPKPFYDILNLDHHLAYGMGLHFFFMWLFFVNGVLYVSYLAFSGEWRCLAPRRHAISDAWRVFLYDLGLVASEPAKEKYNAAQRIAYSAIVAMGAGSIVTGLSIYKPTQLGWLTMLLGGYEWARWEHFWLTIGYCGFFAVHVAQVARAGWHNFRSMADGFDFREGGEGPGGKARH